MNMRYFWIYVQKPLKAFSLHENQDKNILQTILQNIILQNIPHYLNSMTQGSHDMDHGKTEYRKTQNVKL